MKAEVLRNRRRSKQVEKRVATIFASILCEAKRVGILGKEDVVTDHFVVEVKQRRKFAFEPWLAQAQKHAKGKTPLCVCHRTNSKTYYVIMKLEDFLKLVERGIDKGD